jgi:hypothetical protein
MGGAPAETSGSRETGQQVNRRGVSIMPPWAGRGTDCPGASGSTWLHHERRCLDSKPVVPSLSWRPRIQVTYISGRVALAACCTGLLHKWRVATSYAVFAVIFALLV